MVDKLFIILKWTTLYKSKVQAQVNLHFLQTASSNSDENSQDVFQDLS